MKAKVQKTKKTVKKNVSSAAFVGWSKPKNLVPNCDFFTNDGDDTDYKDLKYWVGRESGHNPWWGGNAAHRAAQGRRHANMLHPQSVLCESNNGMVEWKPKVPTGQWFVPIFGDWDGQRDGLLVALAIYGTLTVPQIAGVLGIEGPPYGNLFHFIKHYEEAGLLIHIEETSHAGEQRSYVQLEERAPWYPALRTFLLARAPHFIPRWTTPDRRMESMQPAEPFTFSQEALAKIFRAERPFTMLLLLAAARPWLTTARIASEVGCSSAAISLASDEASEAGALWISKGPRNASVHSLAHALAYAKELQEMCVAFAQSLGFGPLPEVSDFTFREHIRGKQIDRYLRRLSKEQYTEEEAIIEATEFIKIPPEQYTALIRDEEDGYSLHTIKGSEILSAHVEIGEEVWNSGFGGCSYPVAITGLASKADYVGKAYPLQGGWLYTHLTRSTKSTKTLSAISE